MFYSSIYGGNGRIILSDKVGIIKTASSKRLSGIGNRKEESTLSFSEKLNAFRVILRTNPKRHGVASEWPDYFRDWDKFRDK